MTAEVKEWRREISGQQYLVSSSRSLVSLEFVQSAFADDAMWWTKSFSEENLRTMLDNSCNIGLYIISGVSSDANYPCLVQIGIARWITDYVTFAYLTDVYIQPQYQGQGLGKWLIACCADFIERIPELRRSILLTANKKHSIQFYENILGMELWEQGTDGIVVMNRKKNTAHA